MPDAAWAVSVHPPSCSTRHQRFACARLSQPCLSESSPTFPQRSPPSLLTTAACGGLRSAPDCRRDIPSRHVDPSRRLWLEPLCGCAPVELLEAADEELHRDQAEAVRLAYVAATRARELLVAPVCGDRSIDGWLEVLNPTLYPPDEGKRQPRRALGHTDTP